MSTTKKFNSVPASNIKKALGQDSASIKNISGVSNTANTFTFTMQTTAPSETFTLPLGTSGTFAQNFTVDWGDSSSSTITAYDDTDKTHTYTSAGTYTVTMNGVCEYFGFDNGGDRTKMRTLISFTGNMGFKTLNFYGCSGLTSVVSFGAFTALTNATNTFRSCTVLTAIPANMFDSCISITTFVSVLQACTSLTSLPIDLFRYNTSVTSFNSALRGMTALTSLPTDIFRYNTSVTDFTNCLRGLTNASFTSLPADLFRYNTSVTSFTGVLADNTTLTSLPANLFDYNTIVTSFANVLQNCSGLSAIPTDIFKYNVAATSMSAALAGLSGISSVPTDIFRYNTSVTNFTSVFQNCTNHQQNIDIFFATGEEGTRFLNKSVNFTNCFQRTTFTGTIGVAPNLWDCDFGTGTATKTNCWDGAGNSLTSLSNYALIPAAWL